MLFLSLLNFNLLQSNQTEKKKDCSFDSVYQFHRTGPVSTCSFVKSLSVTMDVLNVNQGLDIISTSTTA